MALEAVLLDLGNVLVFHDNAFLSERLSRRLGLSVAVIESRLPALNDPVNTGVFDKQGIRRAYLAAIGGAEIADDDFDRWFNSHFSVNRPMVFLVEKLIGRLKFALVSNTNAIHADFLIPQLPVLEKFEALCLSHQLKAAKPAAAIFETGLKAVAVAPSLTAFFDDIERYAQAASALGINGRVFRDVPGFVDDLRALGVSVEWNHLCDSLLADLKWHLPADEKEKSDLETMRHFLMRHSNEAFSRDAAPTHFTASSLVVNEAGDKVCLVHHKKTGRWLQPGGHIEHTDASVEAAALREIREETGCEAALYPPCRFPIDVDVHTLPPHQGKPPHVHLDIRYLAVAKSTATSAQLEEVHAAQWFTWAGALERCAPGDSLARLLEKGKALVTQV
jgi:glucose-1-phosphatase